MPDVIETPVDRCARAIFQYRWPRASWSDPLFHAERDDCRLLAVQFQEMFAPKTGDVPDWSIPKGIEGCDARWLDAWFSTQLANAISLHIWGRPLVQMTSRVRVDVREYAEAVVEDAVKLYSPILDPTQFWRRNVPETGGVQ